MAVYVDDVRHSFGRMIMCHMWADTHEELVAMADTIGVKIKWIQQPPKASWVHFDISLAMKAKAIDAGAILTDKFGPVEHVAKIKGNDWMVAQVAALRKRRATTSKARGPA